MALASASCETSARTNVAVPPAFSTRSTVSRPAASPYSATTTRAPSAAKELIAAVNDDDAERVTALLAEDPTLVAARDRNGVSAIMLSRYRFDRATTDALMALDPDLDVFEAATLGIIDRLNERLMEDP